MKYLELFLSFAYINLLGFGNALTMIPIFQEQIVSTKHWLTQTEFINLIPISQTTPGPMVINIATFTGVRVAGIFGGVIATIGVTITTAIICLILSILYKKNKEVLFVQELIKILRPVTVALIAIAAISIIKLAIFTDTTVNIIGLLLFISSFIMLRKFRVSFVLIIFGCGFMGVIAKLLI